MCNLPSTGDCLIMPVQEDGFTTELIHDHTLDEPREKAHSELLAISVTRGC